MSPFAPQRITPPADMPVLLSEVKKHLGVDDHNDDDTIITAYVEAATDNLDGWRGWLRRPIVSQGWRLPITSAGLSSAVRLPFGPVVSIDSVTLTGGGVVPSSDYTLIYRHEGPYLKFTAGTAYAASGDPELPAANINFTAGWAQADVPPALKAAIMLHVGSLYENREREIIGPAVTEQKTYRALVRRWRNFT